jgi:hypothetical protein
MSKNLGNPAIAAAAVGNMDKTVQLALLGVVVGAVAYTIYKINSAQQAVKEIFTGDPAVKKAIEEAKTSDAFSIYYWSKAIEQAKPQAILGFSKASAEANAAMIHDAFGLLNDNEERIYAVFRKCTTKASVSRISAAYSAVFHKDLYSDLVENLSDTEMKWIVDYIKPLPGYKTV